MVDLFERDIVQKGEELKHKHPRKAASIDRAVADFKERNKSGEFRDWEDTMLEFIDAALKPTPRPYRSGKRTGEKRAR
jgi:hypothetical protein